MRWISLIEHWYGQYVLGVVGVILITVLFEPFWPALRQPPFFRRPDFKVDAIGLLLKPFVNFPVAWVADRVTRASLALLPTSSMLATVRHQPFWLQVIEAFIVQDFCGYWVHRLQHTPYFWRFHAIHHSSTQLDSFVTARRHPLDNFANFVVLGIVSGIGFDASDRITILVVISGMFDYLAHANLNWKFGPFKYFIGSPELHRWHHSCDAEAIDKNFSLALPVFDVLFGTFYLPRDRPAQNFGDPTLTNSYFRQLIYPFMRHASHTATAGAAAVPATAASDAAPAAQR